MPASPASWHKPRLPQQSANLAQTNPLLAKRARSLGGLRLITDERLRGRLLEPLSLMMAFTLQQLTNDCRVPLSTVACRDSFFLEHAYDDLELVALSMPGRHPSDDFLLCRHRLKYPATLI